MINNTVADYHKNGSGNKVWYNSVCELLRRILTVNITVFKHVQTLILIES